MIRIDEKFKDASPVDTVNKILNLLHEHGFEAEEAWKDSGLDDCYSVRVTIKGTALGSYGKGITRELARASGYAELMERLQSGHLGAGLGKVRFNDARDMTCGEVAADTGRYLQLMSRKIAENEGATISAEELAAASTRYGAMEHTSAIPYMDIMTGEYVYLPHILVDALYRTSGLAAGNSTEEAIVQGFSEIVERYCQGHFLREKLTPPTIPDEYLQKFPTAWHIIEQIRAAGLTVLVKDCSMAEGYPVVASAIVNRETQSYRVIFGSSPVFEIALERSLTETFQGASLDDLRLMSGYFAGSKRNASDIESAFIHGGAIYPIEFFAEKASFEFKPFEDRSHLTNRGLLSYIVHYLREKGRTMLVRDLSHLGFHTYRIIVPGMSEVVTYIFAGEPSVFRLKSETWVAARNLDKATPEQLFAYTLRVKNEPSVRGAIPDYKSLTGIPLKVSLSENRFLALCSAAYANWQTGNLMQAYRYALSAKTYASEENMKLFDCVCQLVGLRLNRYTVERAKELLNVFFTEETLDAAEACLKEGNPFARWLIRCTVECDRCPEKERCQYPVNLEVTEQLNRAVEAFDNEAAFARLRSCFAPLLEQK